MNGGVSLFCRFKPISLHASLLGLCPLRDRRHALVPPFRHLATYIVLLVEVLHSAARLLQARADLLRDMVLLVELLRLAADGHSRIAGRLGHVADLVVACRCICSTTRCHEANDRSRKDCSCQAPDHGRTRHYFGAVSAALRAAALL